MSGQNSTPPPIVDLAELLCNSTWNKFDCPHNFWIIGALQAGEDALEFRAYLESTDSGRRIESKVLINCGATGCFADKEFVHKNGLELYELEYPIPVRNADGSANRAGPITHYIDIFLEIGPHRERLSLEITDLGEKQHIVLSMPWLKLKWNGPLGVSLFTSARLPISKLVLE